MSTSRDDLCLRDGLLLIKLMRDVSQNANVVIHSKKTKISWLLCIDRFFSVWAMREAPIILIQRIKVMSGGVH